MFPTAPSSGALALAPTASTPGAGVFAAARDLHSQLHAVEAAARAHEATRLALAQRRHTLQESLRVLEASAARERAATAALQRELHAERARTGPAAAWSFDFRYDVPAKAVALLGMGDGAPGQGGLRPIFQGCMRQLEQRLALVPKGYARMDDTPENEAGAAKKLRTNAKTLETAKRYVAEKIRQKRRASWEASGKQPRKRRVSKSQIVHKGLLVKRT